MTERWRVDEGFVVGCPVGTVVEVERDGDDIRLVRPNVGVMASFRATTTQQIQSGDQLRLTNADEHVDVALTRVEPGPEPAAGASPGPAVGRRIRGPRPDRPGSGPPPSWATSPLLTSRFGPTRLAFVLGVVSLPFVAMALTSSPRYTGDLIIQPPGHVEAVAMAFVATTVGALVGGTAGGMLLRRHPLVGLFGAMAIAWLVAMASLPIVPGLAGSAYSAGIVCFDGCSRMITADRPLSGALTWGIGEVFGILSIVPVIVAGIALVLASWARRKYRDTLARILVVVAFAVLQFFFVIEEDSLIPLAFLLIGAFIWSTVLAQVPHEMIGASEPLSGT